jgi:hypothetical protein
MFEINIKKIGIFLLVTLMQVAPVIYFPFTSPSEKDITILSSESYVECLDRATRGMYDYYKNNNKLIDGKEPTLELARGLLSNKRIEECKTSAENEMTVVNWPLFTVFFAFIIMPSSWVATKILYFINKIAKGAFVDWSSFKKNLLVILFLVSISVLIAINFFIVFGFCLPRQVVPQQIKVISLVIGLPYLGVVYVLVQALGRTYAYSGQRVHETLIKSVDKKP